jgi:predicted MFS family arabinose efflux permease
MRTANWILATLVLLSSGGVGLYNSWNDLGESMTLLQRSVAIAVLVYGICGVAGGIALAFRKRASIPLAAGWSAGTVYAATVASFAFSDPTFSQGGTVIGVSVAAVATLAICAWVVWSARRSVRDVNLPRGVQDGDIPRR